MDWTNDDIAWIYSIDELFTNLFGPDYYQYEYTEKTKHCVLVPGQFPLIQYRHEDWEQTILEAKQSSSPAAKAAAPHQNNSSMAKGAPVTAATTTQQISQSRNATPPAPLLQQNSKVTGQQHTTTSQHSIGISSAAMAAAPTLAQQLSSSPKATAAARQHSNNSFHSKMLRVEDLNLISRGERAALAVPKVASIPTEDIVLVQNQSEVNNPLLLNLRPSESAVEHAFKLLGEVSKSKGEQVVDIDDDGNEEDQATVTIGTLGTFTKDFLHVLQTMCSLASEAVRVREEQLWLSKNSKSLPDLNNVRDALLNSRPKEEIIRQGTCIMDATDFSTLACERYVNSFAIDTVCMKFLEESKPTKIVFLPSFSQMWAKQGASYFSQQVHPFFRHCAVEDAEYILSPVHFDTPQHWGLLCFDTAAKTVYFDDGLKLSPPRDTISIIKNMLSGFECLSQNASFQKEHWNQPKLDLPLPRLNMPNQTKTGEGAASCGIGVILSVRDIIKSETCPPPFQWMFKNMARLRKELMALVLQWKN